ncbi:hypothetical protein MKOR_05590 [Mycolicibacillus koreensis]|uniref:Uncharacterized protein n=1 Tax=Mycolicibacillus koreensis TaxID=1069220 RepID=A0A7I7S957_9MYCO|nr:hypothetical protein B8W67_03985 [Mycolicibacillus koreensis]BBY53308.1 hypothetical protein MKOR_05590 [Mycolicibacillus koreensis]
MKVKRQTPKRGEAQRRQRRPVPDPADTKTRRRTPAASQRNRSRTGRPAASVAERTAPRTGPQTTPRARGPVRAAKTTGQAQARAKARKAKKPQVVRVPLRERLVHRWAAIDLRPRTLVSRVPFVVVVIGSLGLGLGLTLWLSTDSAERSYELGKARKTNQLLLQQKEALERDVLEAQAAPALAEAARNLGMIPSKDTAHLIQDPAGNWVVVGTPKPAEGVPPPPLNVKLPEEDPSPPPPPPNPVEVPVRVEENPQRAATPSGPEVLIRVPDGSTTLGTEHLPQTPQAQAPGPVAQGPAPGPAPQPPAPAPAPVAAAPADLPAPEAAR